MRTPGGPLLGAVLRRYPAMLRRSPATAVLLLLTVGGVLANVVRRGAREGDVAAGPWVPALAYLGACLLGAVVTDLVAAARGIEARPLPVRRPCRETILVVGCLGAGFGFLWLRFVEGIRPVDLPDPLVRAAFLSGALFLFPVLPFLALLTARYRFADLGFAPRGLLAAPAVVALFGAVAFALVPGQILWRHAVEEMGIGGLLFTGFFVAALPEEVTRMLLQTRLGRLLRSPALGWWIAAFLWAFMHVPKWMSDNPNVPVSVAGALLSANEIVPIGLLWGYMTHRTGSLLPALLAHGLNLWGLQNIGATVPIPG